MKIDFVTTGLSVGGAERCLTELAVGMAMAGDRVRVFSLSPLPQGERRQLVDRLEGAGVEVHSGDASTLLQTGRVYGHLKWWLAKSPPDICQTFMYHANVLGTFAAAAVDITTRVGGLRIAESRPIRLRIERAAVRRMSSLVCVSAAVSAFAASELRCPPDRRVVIPNGVDVSRFASAEPVDWTELGWPADASVALFIGRLHPQKGIELIRRQAERLAPAGSDRRLLLIGDGPQRKEIAGWVEDLGPQRAKLLPWQADVAPWIRAASVLLLPSHYEGMPNVILEAMSAARPVVCSQVEGSQELLAGSAHPQGFAAGDDSAMADLAERYLNDAGLADRVGQSNQARMRKEFSIPAMVAAYRDHYRTLLADRRLET